MCIYIPANKTLSYTCRKVIAQTIGSFEESNDTHTNILEHRYILVTITFYIILTSHKRRIFHIFSHKIGCRYDFLRRIIVFRISLGCIFNDIYTTSYLDPKY